jgi:hypothetical protein
MIFLSFLFLFLSIRAEDDDPSYMFDSDCKYYYLGVEKFFDLSYLKKK